MDAKCLFPLAFLIQYGSFIKADEFPNYGLCKSCYAGYTGDQCEQPLCFGSTTCENGGNCSSPNNCSCVQGYTGNKCELALCFGSVYCENGGSCISPDTCLCSSDFTGEKCETEIPSNGYRTKLDPVTFILKLMTSMCLQLFLCSWAFLW